MQYDPEMLSAAETLLQLSRQAVVFPKDTDTESVRSCDTSTGSFEEMSEAANILVQMSGKQYADSDTTMSADSTVSVSSQQSPKSTWFHNLLQEQPLKDFVRLGLRTSVIDLEAEQKIEAVLKGMPSRSCLQEACWYLDENDWSVARAMAQYDADEKQRLSNASQLFHQLNRGANGINPQNFNPTMLSFKVPANRASKGGQTIHFTGEFDVNNPDHLHALNQWYADMTRMYNGPPAVPDIVGQGYKPVEQRFIRNRYADNIDVLKEGGQPGLKEIADELNAVFQGRYLPGETNPCPKRAAGSVASYIHRKFKDGQPKQVLANYHAALRILAIREQEQKEYDTSREVNAGRARLSERGRESMECGGDDDSGEYVEEEETIGGEVDTSDEEMSEEQTGGSGSDSEYETTSDGSMDLD